ncbi:uncharacterized protein LOC116296420 [Actinia tenebrosa]|uniref:Uncharacterized protein LOC116296420 n=1 Tax=Actinia tenebrosa TaxID=6105 RepID=A0A6P8HY46_ACTTE|nr:uncharacterized protein LOC116296420 [Actinia tenebrosa]
MLEAKDIWLSLATLTCCVFIVSSGNLALRQPAVASSLPKNCQKCFASQAVDGSSLTHYVQNPESFEYCMHSALQENPWWRVDLGNSYIVDQIEILGRSDCCTEELSGAIIRVGNSLLEDGTKNAICGIIGELSAPLKKAFSCPTGMRGRYVTIHLTGAKRSLGICEVIVNKNPTENIALGRITAQSSTHSLDSSKAVDGNSDGRFEAMTCTHTVPSKNPWWRVDFNTKRDVSEVFIVNRDVIRERLSNFEIRIGNSLTNKGNDNPRCGDTLYSMATLPKASFYCKPRKSGRYLNIGIISQHAVLTLCEVEVYSESKALLKNKPQNPTSVQVLGLRSPFSLTCPEAFGYPVPYVAWARDGVVFQNSTTTSVFSGSALRDREAVWECIASNVHGLDYHQFILQGSYRMCAKHRDILVTENLLEASNDNSIESVWFRLRDAKTMVSMKIPNTCVSPWRWSTQATGWMPDAHPQFDHGVVQRTVCFRGNDNCCMYNTSILVRRCHGYYVYKLQGSLTSKVKAALCAETSQAKDPDSMFSSTKPNYALQDHVIYTDKELVIHECMAVCLSDILCQSLNYNTDTKTCEINNATKANKRPLEWKVSPGSQYYEKLDLMNPSYDP